MIWSKYIEKRYLANSRSGLKPNQRVLDRGTLRSEQKIRSLRLPQVARGEQRARPYRRAKPRKLVVQASKAITLKLHATPADTKASIEAQLKRQATVLTVITFIWERLPTGARARATERDGLVGATVGMRGTLTWINAVCAC